MRKISDMISLRAEALELAMKRCHDDYRKTNEILQLADTFVDYIKQDIELPMFMPVPDIVTTTNICNGCDGEEDDGYCEN